ncbi:MAG: DNA polymerase domain-containing protein [Candidatus Hodarchaeota archaeon]
MELSFDFILLDADYEIQIRDGVERPLLRLWGRSNGKQVEVRVNGFFPYFFAQAEEEEIKSILARGSESIRNWLLKTTKCEKRIYFGDSLLQVIKLIGNIPYRVPEVRKLIRQAGIDILEADIPFTRRFLIDRGLKALHPITVTGTIIKQEKDALVLEALYTNLSQDPNAVSDYQPSLLAFDIEVDYKQEETIHELLHEKKRRITAISMAWGTIETEGPDSKVIILETDSDSAEIALLDEFLNTVKELKPDILLSFNGTFFDIPYLTARLSRYGKSLGELALFEGLQKEVIKSQIPVESYRLKGRAVVDLLPKTWGIHPISGQKTLDSVAEEVLGESKVKLTKSLGELWWSGINGSEKDAQLFRDYSLQDAILTFRLAAELGVSNSIELCRLSGYPLPEGILSTSRNIGELELMRILYSHGMFIPSKPSQAELRTRKEFSRKYPHLGGWVLDPKVAEASNVAILDFRSLYPNIVRTHNISGETLISNSESLPYDQRFKKKPRGALAELMDRILKQRYQTQEEIRITKEQHPQAKIQKHIDILEKRQRSLKLMANSLLGASNYPRGRFYHHIIANSITAIARELLRDKLEIWTNEFSENHPYNVLLRYGDTDSIFIEFVIPDQNSVDIQRYDFSTTKTQERKQLLKAINNYRSFLSEKLPEFLELQLEDVASRIILKKGRKKAYAYVSMLSNNIVIRGFEAIRSDWSPLARKAQRELLKTLLTDQSVTRRENARRKIFNICRNILRGQVSHLIPDLTIRGPLRRSPTKYRSKTPSVGAFLHYCDEMRLDPEIEWKKWDGFPYIIGKGSLNEPQYLRAYHPDAFRKKQKIIDRMHYVREILGASNRFGIHIRESEAQQGAFIIPLTVFFNQQKN